mmetsp:Transcript_5385/g.10656  ORF Transcript_5385/g.10656 Transcript_5385/m.10656 type:complete len:215 (+) Transcript_5385:340-984(+)
MHASEAAHLPRVPFGPLPTRQEEGRGKSPDPAHFLLSCCDLAALPAVGRSAWSTAVVVQRQRNWGGSAGGSVAVAAVVVAGGVRRLTKPLGGASRGPSGSVVPAVDAAALLLPGLAPVFAGRRAGGLGREWEGRDGHTGKPTAAVAPGQVAVGVSVAELRAEDEGGGRRWGGRRQAEIRLGVPACGLPGFVGSERLLRESLTGVDAHVLAPLPP